MVVGYVLRQGPAHTPHDILVTIDKFVENNGQPAAGQSWEYVRKWCLVASQVGTGGNSRNSKVFLEPSPATIDDTEFDRWVGNRLDMIFGPHPAVLAVPPAGLAGNQNSMD